MNILILYCRCGLLSSLLSLMILVQHQSIEFSEGITIILTKHTLSYTNTHTQTHTATCTFTHSEIHVLARSLIFLVSSRWALAIVNSQYKCLNDHNSAKKNRKDLGDLALFSSRKALSNESLLDHTCHLRFSDYFSPLPSGSVGLGVFVVK